MQVPNRMLADDADFSPLIRQSNTAISAGVPECTAISAMIVATGTLPNDHFIRLVIVLTGDPAQRAAG
jgi:hypothetical protein